MPSSANENTLKSITLKDLRRRARGLNLDYSNVAERGELEVMVAKAMDARRVNTISDSDWDNLKSPPPTTQRAPPQIDSGTPSKPKGGFTLSGMPKATPSTSRPPPSPKKNVKPPDTPEKPPPKHGQKKRPDDDPTNSRFARASPVKKKKLAPLKKTQSQIQKEKVIKETDTKLKITNTFMDGQLNRYKKSEDELKADEGKTYDEITGIGDIRGVEAEELGEAVYRTNKFMPAKKVKTEEVFWDGAASYETAEDARLGRHFHRRKKTDKYGWWDDDTAANAAHKEKLKSIEGEWVYCECTIPTLVHRIASHRIASHRIASHRVAPHRTASSFFSPQTQTQTQFPN